MHLIRALKLLENKNLIFDYRQLEPMITKYDYRKKLKFTGMFFSNNFNRSPEK